MIHFKVIPHISEKYRCDRCQTTFGQQEAQRQKWICSTCLQPMAIRVEVGGFAHSGNRLMAKDLKEGMLITLERDFIYEIGEIEIRSNRIHFHLKGYGGWNPAPEHYVLTINGSW